MRACGKDIADAYMMEAIRRRKAKIEEATFRSRFGTMGVRKAWLEFSADREKAAAMAKGCDCDKCVSERVFEGLER